MRRVDRRKLERVSHIAVSIGLSFALGALTATTLEWRLRERALTFSDDAPPQVRVTSSDRAAAEADPDTPDAVPTTGIEGHQDALTALRARHIEVPVKGVARRDLIDSFNDSRSGHAHEALDIMAPRRTPVIAADDGTIAKLFTSKAGGLTIYQFDPTGTLCYYYAHLDDYALGVREGERVDRGDTLGYVGSTGNASEKAPHLHFAVFRLASPRQWSKGTPINPYPLLK